MKTTQGGSMASIILFGVSIVALIAAVVLYSLKDDTTSKKWAEQTKVIVDENDKLKSEWQQAIDTVKGLCENHNAIAGELDRQKQQLARLEYAQNLPAKPLQLPSTINFTVVERRKIQKVDDRGTLKPLVVDSKTPLNGAAKPTTTEQKVIKKIKKQIKELSQ
jgi:hypothetical protein